MQLSADLHKDKNMYDKLIRDVSAQIRKLEEKQTKTTNRREQLEEYVSLTHLTHEIVNQLIDSILVGKRDPETGKIPIEINWKF